MSNDRSAAVEPAPFASDLHVHTSASFDSLASPASVVRAAAARGLTHLAITDHDRIDGALAARALAAELAPNLTILVGQEVKTRDGDLICVFLERPIPTGLPAAEAIAAARDQGGPRRDPPSVRPLPRFAASGPTRSPASRRSSTGSRSTTPG